VAQAGSVPNFRRVPTVLTAQELVDKAFHKASLISVPSADPFARIRGTEIARLRSVANTLDATLTRYVKSFPSFDRLPPFYRDLSRAIADVDRARQALGALDWARGQILSLADETVARMKRARTGGEIADERRKAYGRIASILKQVSPDLAYLNEARDALKAMPHLDTSMPTIVVAGYPNVGKSSFVRAVSSAEPEVAPYPFTTKGIVVGHVERRRVQYQIVDTPGLLDRPLEDRNAIERQAIAALAHIGDAIVFLLDPSELCGYSLAAQERLLEEVRPLFPATPLLVVENKADAEGRFGDGMQRPKMSTLTGDGVQDLCDAACREALAIWKRRRDEEAAVEAEAAAREAERTRRTRGAVEAEGIEGAPESDADRADGSASDEGADPEE
jgi:nucleolar GTP-binding protein